MAPTILDKFVDPEKDSHVGGLRPSSAEDIPARSVEDSICRDLQWLFNTTSLECILASAVRYGAAPDMRIDDLANVRTSVLNYGVRTLTGRPTADLQSTELRTIVREAIERFEPRLIVEDVRDEAAREDPDASTARSRFLRRVTVIGRARTGGRLAFETEVDLARGFTRVSRRSGAVGDR